MNLLCNSKKYLITTYNTRLATYYTVLICFTHEVTYYLPVLFFDIYMYTECIYMITYAH